MGIRAYFSAMCCTVGNRWPIDYQDAAITAIIPSQRPDVFPGSRLIRLWRARLLQCSAALLFGGSIEGRPLAVEIRDALIGLRKLNGVCFAKQPRDKTDAGALATGLVTIRQDHARVAGHVRIEQLIS